MFGALVIEQGHEPLTLEGLPAAFQNYVLVIGSLAGAALAVWLVAYVVSRLVRRTSQVHAPAASPAHAFASAGGAGADGNVRRAWGSWLLWSLLGGAAISIVVAALPRVWSLLGWAAPATAGSGRSAQLRSLAALAGTAGSFLLFFLAGCAIAGLIVPIVRNFSRLRWRRVWALARLSIKEAVRSKVLWGFSFLLLVFLFGSWFLPAKSERQFQTYVETVFATMGVLLLIPAGLLAAFSIPNDLRRQTIHTIVTKPVERFEIILGRVCGYVVLMTGVLLVMTLFSLIYVVRGVDEDSRQESFRARVPVYGDLSVPNGKSVGREWEYRSYVGYFTNSPNKRAQAIWSFHKLPAGLGAGKDSVRVEFEFDIFRTTKGEEGKPVLCSLAFMTPRWEGTDAKRTEYRRKRREAAARSGKGMLSPQELDSRLAEDYGYFEVADKGVVDYHTESVEVPASLFRNIPRDAGEDRPPLAIVVECQSANQFLGVAKHDLYLLADERSVWLNFFKGAAGIWFLMCLVIGVGVTCSTYLSGVISCLVTFVLLLLGLILPYMGQVIRHEVEGPMQSLIRLYQPGTSIAQPLGSSPTVTLARVFDASFSVTLRLVQHAFPDVKHFSLTDYVARGFDISAEKLFVDDLLPLFGYLLPWAVLAFYLIKAREIAN